MRVFFLLIYLQQNLIYNIRCTSHKVKQVTTIGGIQSNMPTYTSWIKAQTAGVE